MTLQNRVDPFGAIHAVPDRGMFTGNRGVIHDPQTRTLLGRRWTTRAWIICLCEFGGRRRDPMGLNGPAGRAGWTELFFLDEVTALASGHRPCFFCRRAAAAAFARNFPAGAPATTRRGRARAAEMDRILHRQRAGSGNVLPSVDLPLVLSLPDGAMVAVGEKPHAVVAGRLVPWSFAGYGRPAAPGDLAGRPLLLITPPATVEVLRLGYRPVWHPSLAARAMSTSSRA